VEYRAWNPFRSKLAAAILGGIDQIHIRPGAKVLYLGAASGTTVSHVSDIVGPVRSRRCHRGVGKVKGHEGGAIDPTEVASRGTLGTSLVAMGTSLRTCGDVTTGWRDKGTWGWHWGTLGDITMVGGVKGQWGGAISPVEMPPPGHLHGLGDIFEGPWGHL